MTDDRAKDHHASLTIKSFYPSLHLNVGDAFLRLGDLDEADKHAWAEVNAMQPPTEPPLAEMTRKGVAGLRQRIEQARVNSTEAAQPPNLP